MTEEFESYQRKILNSKSFQEFFWEWFTGHKQPKAEFSDETYNSSLEYFNRMNKKFKDEKNT